MAKAWYCGRTGPRAEFLVASLMEGQGVEVFLPTVRAEWERRGHREVPVFPGYLFLRVDLEAGEGERLRWVPRFRGLVRFGGSPMPVPEEAVASLREWVEGVRAEGGLVRRFAEGERVRVLIGRWGMEGWVLEDPGRLGAPVRVRVHFLGRWMEAWMPRASLEPAAPVKAPRPPRRTRGKGRWIRGFGPRAGEG